MTIALLDQAILDRFPELRGIAEDIRLIGEGFASRVTHHVTVNDESCRGLSWRCRAFAAANLLRGEELFRLAVLAMNEGGIIAACTLARGLDETLAAVIFARRRIERCVKKGETAALEDLLHRLLYGTRALGQDPSIYPKAENVLNMVDEAGKYFEEAGGADTIAVTGSPRDHYEFISEYVHPNVASLIAYREVDGNIWRFDRALGGKPSTISGLLRFLRFAGVSLLEEATRLEAVQDLSPNWPDRD